MKKILVASVCTLGLTLLGAFGNYQNSLTLTNALGAEKSTTNVEQYITKYNLNCLPGDNNSLANTVVKQDTSNKGASANASTAKPNMVYKNVNLSNCKSTKEVVKKLQNNGVKGVTTSNVKKIKGLKDILACINKNNKNTTQTQASKANTTTTKKPASTTTGTTATKKSDSTTKTTTTQTPASTNNTTTANSSDLSSYADQVLKLVNQERAKQGLPALTTNKTLQAAANKRAQEIVQSFSHTRPNGSSPFTVLNEYGISYKSAGENIAYGQKTPADVMNAWMNSSGHRANILKNGFGKVGIGVYKVNGVIYWTQLFTN